MIKRLIPSEVLYFVITTWIVFLANTILISFNLNQFGIRPRQLDGLTGILLSPFLHTGLYHIISNTISTLVLGCLLDLSVSPTRLRYIMFLGAIGSGIGVWCFGDGGIVVGSSGMIFAILGFLLASATLNPSLRSWGIALVAFFTYGSALLSFIHFIPYTSWAAHFWGFISGVLLCILFRNKRSD
ncbi:MAG: rhomboid family intramembrane serine protease [Oceanospirillaceae bacterium]|nr:rhomboid family intramembrane serine protease [Oceanospirillaceae bacterium]